MSRFEKVVAGVLKKLQPVLQQPRQVETEHPRQHDERNKQRKPAKARSRLDDGQRLVLVRVVYVCHAAAAAAAIVCVAAAAAAAAAVAVCVTAAVADDVDDSKLTVIVMLYSQAPQCESPSTDEAEVKH